MMTAVSLDQFKRNVNDASASTQEVIDGTIKALGVIAVAGARQHFTDQSGPDGKKWDSLKHPRPDGGGRILEDKGLLKASIQARTVKGMIQLVSSHPAANLHQYGGTITPKIARALAIPLTREAKRTGSPRRNGFPRPLFIVKTKNGKAFLAESNDGKLVWHYILVRQVKVGKREFLGFSAKTLDKMERLLALRLMQKVQSAFDPTVKMEAVK